MILIKEFTLKKFRNINDIALKDLRDLNILIGPNNCGKTNIFEFLNRFSQLAQHRAYRFLCSNCNTFKDNTARLDGILLPFNPEDYYMKSLPKDGEVEASLLYDKDAVSKLLFGGLPKSLESNKPDCPQVEDRITLKNTGGNLVASHFSPFLHPDVLERIKPVLYCVEERLQTYKSLNFPEYIEKIQLTGTQKTSLINLIARLIDPRITDYKGNDLRRRINDSEIDATIAEQGSGVRSLICMSADILSNKSNVVLVDEPELGLNPFVKQELLRFLLDLAKERQIFIATQDSAFVNPVLWRDDLDRVSVHLFSLQTEDFVKVSLYENKEDPEIFAAYLPHTTSLKSTHIYVEGPNDVYVFQVFLRKFLKEVEQYNAEAFKVRTLGVSYELKHARLELGDRFQIENRIGIFHLKGDLWPHLLYTVPKAPYRCIVILDGNKKTQVPDVIEKHNKSIANVSRFEFAKSIKEISDIFQRGDCHPVYCLDKNDILDYLSVNITYPIHDARGIGARGAETLEKLPSEIYGLFMAIVGPPKYSLY